jgi:hypothetical protein
MTKGQFKFQKIADVGTDNPIVAGLTIGLFDIVKMAEIGKENQDAINASNFKIVHSLTKAEKIGLQICANIGVVMENLNETGVQTQSSERCVSVPSTGNLDDVREFLKYCKQSLQELVKIINLFCDIGSSLPRYDRICKKLKEFYGDADPVYLQVQQDHDGWLKKLLDLRNADEHPDTMIPQGKQLYYDFDINWSEQYQKWIVKLPHFYEGTPVYELIKSSIHNIFTFAEDINIIFLQKKMPRIVEICKVPEDQRAKRGGRRYVAQLKPPFYPKGVEPEGRV